MFFDDEFKVIVSTHLKCGSVPMLYGEPGIGKSSWVESLAHDMGATFFCLACNQLAAKEDLTGARLVPVKKKDGTETFEQKFYPHTVIRQAINTAEDDPNKKVILFLDEINRTTPDVTSALLSIPTMRSIGNWELPNNVMVILAGNDHGNVTALDEASVSRFVVFHMQPNVDKFLAVNPDINRYVEIVLKAHPDYLFCKQIADRPAQDENADPYDDDAGASYLDMVEDEGQAQFTTPRTIAAASRFLNEIDDAHLLSWSADTYMTENGEVNRLQEALEGICGHTLFTLELISTIANELTKATTTNSHININKPNEFESLMAATDYTSLEAAIDALSDSAKSHNLLWALYDKRDCSVVIGAIAGKMAHFDSTDARTFTNGVNQDAFNADNVTTFVNSDTQLGNMYAIALGL